MPTISASGIDLYYEVEGEGFPLLLVAGYTCSISKWNLMRERLAENYQLILIDNRGVGRSGCPQAPYSIGDMANDGVFLLDHLRVKRAHVVGHSMGVAIAQKIAAYHPERVEKLVLCNTSSQFNTVCLKALSSLLALSRAKVDPMLVFNATAPWIFSSHFLSNEGNMAAVMQAMSSDLFPQTLLGQEGQFNALLTFSSKEDLAKISAPTLIITGEQDLIISVSEAKDLAAHIAHARVHIMTDMGHDPLIEDPRGLCSLVREFLT